VTGAVALAEYIAESRCLQHMDLRENEIKTAGLMALALSLKVNRSVTRIDLDKDPKKEVGSLCGCCHSSSALALYF
jgi:protein phosphatase 1 regulatory subunit 37